MVTLERHVATRVSSATWQDAQHQYTAIAQLAVQRLAQHDQLVPIVHGTTYQELREVSPMLASRNGLDTAEMPMADVAAKLAELVTL